MHFGGYLLVFYLLFIKFYRYILHVFDAPIDAPIDAPL